MGGVTLDGVSFTGAAQSNSVINGHVSQVAFNGLTYEGQQISSASEGHFDVSLGASDITFLSDPAPAPAPAPAPPAPAPTTPAPSPPTTPAPSPAPTPSGEVTINPVRSQGYCLDLPGGDTSLGTQLWMWECDGSPRQTWIVDEDAGNIRFAGDPSKC